ncbi:methyl-accepting chemotaxis protein [Azospirillum sp. ST 5-10]|uniref:methyl-accepting chemotaxis protein n=1 Tax=unclassified Azospirillum TaxID=2630922 RepID=UPI003F4A1DFE
MTTSTTADGSTGGSDLTGRLTQMTNRTNLMVIDATLNALPPAAPGEDGQGYAVAAAEVRALARRMLRAAGDFAETIGTEAVGAGREPV